MHRHKHHGAVCRSGLTRVEAVVIVALIALLSAAIHPVLLNARGNAPAAVCMTNLKALMQAWLLYAKDYDDNLVGSATYDTTAYQTQQYPTTRRVWNFVGTPQGENGNARNNTVEDELRGIRKGALWGYLENEQTYHCPSDRRCFSQPAGDFPGGTGWGLKGGYRTYSIGAVYNGFMTPDSGWPTGEAYVTVYKTTGIVTPSDKVVFLEENDGYGYNANTWNMYINRKDIWGDPFAILHQEQTVFGYADGHAALHRWQNQSTLDMAEMGYKQYPIPPNERDDIDWFRWRYVPGEMPEQFKDI